MRCIFAILICKLQQQVWCGGCGCVGVGVKQSTQRTQSGLRSQLRLSSRGGAYMAAYIGQLCLAA